MQTRRDIDRRIHELASRTCAVVHARDLRAAGVGRDAIADRIADGTVAQLAPRTYAVGPACHEPSRSMLAMAGVLSAGAGASIDGETAGELLGVWDRADPSVHVAVPGRTVRTTQGASATFCYHRVAARWSARTGRLLGPIPVVGYVDMCLRMACTLTPWQLAFVMQRGIYERHVTLDQLAASARLHARRPWICVYRGAVELVRSGSAGTRSRSEDRLLGCMLQHGIEVPLVNTKGALGLARDEPDFAWIGARVNVEVDGGHHDEPAQVADDDVRDREAAQLGFYVLRVRARDVRRRPRAIVRVIDRAMAGERGLADPGARYVRNR